MNNYNLINTVESNLAYCGSVTNLIRNDAEMGIHISLPALLNCRRKQQKQHLLSVGGCQASQILFLVAG